MRITNQMLTDGFMQNLRANLRNLDAAQRQLSSGKTINRPSDDPMKLQLILKLDTALDQRNQYIRSIEDADSWLTATDAALGQVGDVLNRVKELGIKGQNSTYNLDDLNAMATEVGQLLEHLGEVANTTHAGRYLFGGSDTAKQPYAVQVAAGTASIQFIGPNNAIEYEVGQNVTLKVNTTGQDAFGGIELLDAVEELRQGLLTGDTDRLNQAMQRLDGSTNTLLAARADVGARMNRLEATKSRYQDDILNLTTLKSQAEDADLAEVVMHLKTQEAVYQAALQAGARIMQPSLLDYLR